MVALGLLTAWGGGGGGGGLRIVKFLKWQLVSQRVDIKAAIPFKAGTQNS